MNFGEMLFRKRLHPLEWIEQRRSGRPPKKSCCICYHHTIARVLTRPSSRRNETIPFFKIAIWNSYTIFTKLKSWTFICTYFLLKLWIRKEFTFLNGIQLQVQFKITLIVFRSLQPKLFYLYVLWCITLQKQLCN